MYCTTYPNGSVGDMLQKLWRQKSHWKLKNLASVTCSNIEHQFSVETCLLLDRTVGCDISDYIFCLVRLW